MSAERRDLWLIPGLAILAHVVVLRGYGWFRDEFYYLACAAHPDYGYVDHPALSILPLWLVRASLGDSLVAVRLLAAGVMGAAVFVIGRLVDELGGAGFARVLAMTCAAISPVHLAFGSYYSMNAWDVLAWALAAWCLIRALRTSSLRAWVALGVVLGLGLENKISVLWLVGGHALGVSLSEPRQLASRGIWISGAIAGLLSAPYILWQTQHQWATLTFIRQASGSKMLVQSPADFLLAQVLNLHPASLPVWLAGLWFLIRREAPSFARPLGISFLAVLALLLANATSRASYLAPAYAPLLAAGACFWEQRIGSTRRWARTGVIATLVLSGAALAPLAMPVLSVESYIRFAAAVGQKPRTEEKKAIADLPQFFADRFGWPEWVDAVERTYRSLPENERRVTAIFASNYGEAGAIDVLGQGAGLPPARSGHNNYWWWGPGPLAEVVIALVPADSRARLEQLCESVVEAGTIECEHCMPYENHRPIFVCRRPRRSLAEIWPDLKHYD